MAKKSPANPSTAPRQKKSKKMTKQQKIILAAGLLLIVGAGAIFAYIKNAPQESVVRNIPVFSTPTPTPEPKDTPNPLNGILYTKAEAKQKLNRRPLAVMVENHVEARPQAGLDHAEILYEGMAEGGITRFMAMYLANTPEKITPVRSARLHFVDWAAEYDAGYTHWGGSNESLQFLRNNSRPKDLDQFIYGSAFYRDYSAGRSLEHTGATSIKNLRQILSSKGWEQPTDFVSWDFKSDSPESTRPEQQTVSVGFLGTWGYDARFTYDKATNTYLRSTGGQLHKDANGQQLSAKTIVIMYQPVTSYVDEFGKPAVSVDTTGSGKLAVIQDGKAVTGTWNKASRNSRTQLRDNDGKSIKLNRGKIWIISAPTTSPVSY